MSQARPVLSAAPRTVLLLIGILLVAANLRAPITGLAPVLGMIQDAFALRVCENFPAIHLV